MTVTVPFARTINPGDHGPDVEAVKRALVKWNVGKPQGVNVSLYLMGAASVALLKLFQHGSGLKVDGVYGPATHAKLAPYIDAFGASLIAREAATLHPPLREAFVAQLRKFNADRVPKHYAEVRPMNLEESDCSGSITMAAKASGCPDPNGLGFNGQGWTGTMLSHGRLIARSSVQPGDLAVFGVFPGHHVIAYLGGDEWFSHGHEGDPGIYTFAAQAANQPSVVTYVSFIP